MLKEGSNSKKRCTHCKKRKLITEFNRQHNAWDGLSAWCRECNNENRNKWRYNNIDLGVKLSQYDTLYSDEFDIDTGNDPDQITL